MSEDQTHIIHKIYVHDFVPRLKYQTLELFQALREIERVKFKTLFKWFSERFYNNNVFYFIYLLYDMKKVTMH